MLFRLTVTANFSKIDCVMVRSRDVGCYFIKSNKYVYFTLRFTLARANADITLLLLLLLNTLLDGSVSLMHFLFVPVGSLCNTSCGFFFHLVFVFYGVSDTYSLTPTF